MSLLRMAPCGVLLALVAARASALGLGVELGVQRDAPSVRDDREYGASASFAAAAGLLVDWRAHGALGARAEALYARRSFASPAFVTDTPLVVDLLELALVVSPRLGPAGRSFELRAEAGPQLGCRLRARRRFRDVDQDVANELREADLKALFGLRAEHGSFFVGARFALGLTDLDATNQQRICARTLTLLVGYRR